MADTRGQRVIARGALALGILLAWGPCAWALDPALDVSQYAHTAWKSREGFSQGIIYSIAQTSDGYLWLGTEFGLLRFDGVKTIPWEPPADQHLPSSKIESLLVARDGTLWIGTWKGLASWKDGKLTQYSELAGLLIMALLEDRDGTVWAGGFANSPPGKLCAIQNGTVHCYGDDGTLGAGAVGLYDDSEGNLWAGVLNGLWRWKPGPPKFYPLAGEPSGIQALAGGDDGALLIAMRGRVAKFIEGKFQAAYPYPVAARDVYARTFLRDRDGGLWVGSQGGGLVHVHTGTTDTFGQADGLSSDDITAVFQDREGSVWVGTVGGLDRFRDFAVFTFSEKQGFPDGAYGPVLAARDGSVWQSGLYELRRWSKGQITIYQEPKAKTVARDHSVAATVRKVILSGLPKYGYWSLFEDDRARIWVAGDGGVGYLDNDRYISIRGVPGGIVYSIAGDTKGNLWIANFDGGLLHLFGESLVQQIPWATLGHKAYASALATDPSQGGLWLGFADGGVVFFKDNVVRASYATADGLGKGLISDLRLDQDGALWAATEGGLSRLKNGRVTTLSSKNGLPCDAVRWAREDDDHSFWVYMSCGLVRVARSDLDAWGASPDRRIDTAVFNTSDGVRNMAAAPSFSPKVAKSSDGRLWFTNYDGVSVVDPHRLPFNKLPPPVHVEQIAADGKTYWQNSLGDASSSHPRLPPLVRDLTIDYTALSLVVPEKVHFRFKLDGQDRDWREVVNGREVQYSNLAPGSYRFRVTASNNSGVWNEEGAILDFSIAPAYYQTIWFRSLCVAAFFVMLWGLYRLRVRQVAHQFNMALEARVSERTRIARDLHDTLLQSFHGLLLRFQAVSNLLPERPVEAKQRLENAVEQAAQAITEGRDAVQELRSSTVVTNDLPVAISALGQELAAAETTEDSAIFRVVVEGTPRNLHPILRDEVYRIAGEALRNAFRHAQARQIEVEIHYDERRLRLRVRDDGKGMDPEILGEHSRPGHFGLHGMRERARIVGGQLDVWSERDSGTEVELSVPASKAYATPPATRRSWLAEKLSGKGTQVKS